jgi:hypothetical protein
MAEVSIIELIIYGIICYTGVVGLILSAFRQVPDERSQSGVRVIWLIPSLIASYMMANAGGQIDFTTKVVSEIGYNVTDSTIISNSTVTTIETMNLVQPVWVTLHFLLFIMLLIYVIWNIINMLTKVK